VKLRLKLGALLLALLLIAFSGVGRWLESSMLSHVLVEIPLLVFIGWALGKIFRRTLCVPLGWINAGGISGLLLASFTLGFWMIPRWLDASLVDSSVAGLKYASLVLLVGFPLALSWPMAHSITRAVVRIELLTMLFRLGWIYIISPVRLCNNYLIDDQARLGEGFLLIGFALAMTWLLPVFFGSVNAGSIGLNARTSSKQVSTSTRCS